MVTEASDAISRQHFCSDSKKDGSRLLSMMSRSCGGEEMLPSVFSPPSTRKTVFDYLPFERFKRWESLPQLCHLEINYCLVFVRPQLYILTVSAKLPLIFSSTQLDWFS